ncbi:hypothetical protein AB0H77_15600 [Streptomyces sp. NPDC050844]|uniref:hypothetical protein n=1 Tax=Streptomyces sp. NPDC050844 TaxID=3155790 RepID=UPI0034078757
MTEVADDATAQSWLSTAFNVLTMDDVWTRSLNAERLSREEMYDAAELGERLQDTWLRLTDGGALKQIEQYVRQHAHRAAETAEQGDTVVVATDPMEFQKTAIKAFTALGNASEQEAAQLQRSVMALRASTRTQGDLSPTSRCLIIVGCAITAFALAQPAIGTLFGTWFVKGGCPKLTLGITEIGG